MGRRTKSTFVPKWNSGETKPIRIPKKLIPQVLKIARLLDAGLSSTEQELIEFLLVKQNQYRRSRKPFDRSTPRWAVFNEFERWLKNSRSH